ncbi:DUF6395 domain-containing protein [Escherichia coli]|uniref:DUF6395 domain-containing protein n=1 Tax=Escherichia coli TaxID=562 RepID=UPI000DDEF905|nr:DUF6395 domain-containing protein [Escherichia coli]HAW1909491.1 hypothetical protein [Escherichia coli]HBN7130837.1 hypothetical protein [Escherichia coli]
MNTSFKFQKVPKPYLLITYIDDDFHKEISFNIPNDFFISNDSLVALIVACRPKLLSEISFDFAISERAKAIIEKDYNLKVVKIGSKSEIPFFGFDIDGGNNERTENYLNFSGGVDSLGAYYLTRKSAHLISIDFGSRFARESNFFSEWNTYIVKTNFRDKPFNEKIDWRFIAAGAILMSDYLKIKTLFFGTILEASPWWFKFEDRNSFENSNVYQVFRLANLKIAQPVASLSEYGTTLLALKFGESTLDKSVISSSDIGSSKFFRKSLLQKIVKNEIISPEWVERNKPKTINHTGQSFSEDILALYFASKLGIDFVNKNIIKTSADFDEISNSVDMSFFEKYNQKNLSVIPIELRNEFQEIIRICGMKPYDQEDIINFNKVRNYLDEKYNI